MRGTLPVVRQEKTLTRVRQRWMSGSAGPLAGRRGENFGMEKLLFLLARENRLRGEVSGSAIEKREVTCRWLGGYVVGWIDGWRE